MAVFAARIDTAFQNADGSIQVNVTWGVAPLPVGASGNGFCYPNIQAVRNFVQNFDWTAYSLRDAVLVALYRAVADPTQAAGTTVTIAAP